MTDLALAPSNGAALAEQVVIKGDLSKLTETDRMSYYSAVCTSLGLNPLTRPFEYISLNGKLTLYATRAAGDQLRAIRGITITNLDPRQIGDLFVVTATGRDRTGREDASTGAVSTAGLRGEALANAMMKAETKAKRRLTLSLAGLGWTDETEVDAIPGAERVETPTLSLAERAAQARAAIEPSAQEAPAEPSVETVTPDEVFAPEAAGSSSPEPAATPPAPLSKQAFVDRLDAAGIDQQHATTLRLVMFPNVTQVLDDAQRGALWQALEAEQLASA